LIPTVLKASKSFRNVVRYVGRDDTGAQQKKRLPLTDADCGVFNMEADCGTSEDRELIWQLMEGDAAQARYRGNPLYHFDVSWMEGEHPAREQCEQAARHFVDGLGFGNCQTFWAVHRDTDHDHLHVVVCKVILDESGKATVIEKPRFDYRELARLAREIEMAQGWEHAPGYYVAVELGKRNTIMPMKEAIQRGLWDGNWEVQKKISLAASRVESHNLGGDSFQAWIGEEPARALRETVMQPGATWESAHETLAKFGARMDKKGSGLIVATTLDDGRILAAKASQLGQWASKAALEKILGPYQQPPEIPAATVQKTYQQAIHAQRVADSPADQEPQNSSPNSDRQARKAARAAARQSLAARFEQQQKDAKQVRRNEQKAQRDALRDQHQKERTVLKAALAGQRRQLFRSAKQQSRLVTPIELALHARDRAMQLEALQIRQAQERKTLTQSFPKPAAVWRAWVEQQAQQGDEAAQAAWRGIRYAEQRKKKIQANALAGEETEPQRVHTLAQFRAEIDQRNQSIIYRSADGAARFVDTGPRIVLKDRAPATDTLEAALRLATQRYNNQVSITGAKEFREQAARMAARLGIRVKDDDLKAIVDHEKARIQERALQQKRQSARLADQCDLER